MNRGANMTREQAIEIFSSTDHHVANGDWIDVFVKLGMLKLDEPINLDARATDALRRIPVSERYPDEILRALRDAGLKIVEK